MKIVKNILFKCINSYCSHFPFPKKGMGLFLRFLETFNLQNNLYKKKCTSGLYCNVNAIDHIQKIILWEAEYEKEVLEFADSFLKEGDNVIDIGANIGFLSIHFSQIIKFGKVYCFEPNEKLHLQLKNNFSINNLNNYTLESKAISSENTSSFLNVSNQHNTGLSSLSDFKNINTIEIETIKLDDYTLPNNVTLIKIDVEGAELNALKGMKNVLLNHKPFLIVEIVNKQLQNFNSNSKEVYSFLLHLQYSAYKKEGNKYLKITDDNTEGYSVFFIPMEKEHLLTL